MNRSFIPFTTTSGFNGPNGGRARPALPYNGGGKTHGRAQRRNPRVGAAIFERLEERERGTLGAWLGGVDGGMP